MSQVPLTGAERAAARFKQMLAWGRERCGPISNPQPRQATRRHQRKMAKAFVAQQRREAIRTRRLSKPRAVTVEV